MALLGTPLLSLLALLAIGLPPLVLRSWSRVRGHRAVRLAQRLGLLAGSQIVAVLVVAIALNDYGDFYGSWNSLFRDPPHGARINAADQSIDIPIPRQIRGRASAGRITLLRDPAHVPRSQWPVRGRLERVALTGASSALSEDALIYLPPQYFQPRYVRDRFPAIEMLSDAARNEASALSEMEYRRVLRYLVGLSRRKPTVVVMLRPAVTYPRDTECTNVPAGPQSETFYASDLPAQIADQYRVRPTGWGAIGAATGGYCAAKLAMLHPHVFYAAVANEGYFNAIQDQATGNLWGGSSVLRNLNDLEWRLRNLPPPPVSLLVVPSSHPNGRDGYIRTKRFEELARSPMTVRMIPLRRDSHDVAPWGSELPVQLDWLAARLPQIGHPR